MGVYSSYLANALINNFKYAITLLLTTVQTAHWKYEENIEIMEWK